MNRFVGLTTVLLLLLSAASCGDGKSAESYTPEQLGDALVTTEELGSGWTQTQRDVFTERQPENPSIDSSLWCPAASNEDASMQELAGLSGADAEFEFAMTGDVNRGMRVQAWNNADADRYFESLSEAYDRCNGETWDDGEGNAYTVSPAEGPATGEESLHWVVRIESTTDGDDSVWNSRQSVIRFGNTLLVMQLGDVAPGDTLEPMDDAEWGDIVSSAASKIEALSA